MATSEGIPSSIDIEFLELNDNPYVADMVFMQDIHVTDAEEQERLWLIM